jgi:O-antigen/teichoic acid export membrane protein
MNAPLWGAYADANARNDKRFIRKTLIRSTSITALIATISSVIIFFASYWIIDVWTEGAILFTIPFHSYIWLFDSMRSYRQCICHVFKWL